jgi:hypothetical protein
MTKAEYFKQFRIDVITNTVFISGKQFHFAYTPANDVVKEEYIGKYRYFGGLQCDYNSESEEYKRLERWLCELAEQTLLTITMLK